MRMRVPQTYTVNGSHALISTNNTSQNNFDKTRFKAAESTQIRNTATASDKLILALTTN